jgi:hypothetical protein
MSVMKKYVYYGLAFIFAVILFLAPFLCFADTIKCYSGSKVVYYHRIGNIRYTGEVFIFEQESNGEVVMYNGKCIVKLEGED